MQDFFPSMTLKPNPACEEKICHQRQREYQVPHSFAVQENVAPGFVWVQPLFQKKENKDSLVSLKTANPPLKNSTSKYSEFVLHAVADKQLYFSDVESFYL